MKKNKFFSILSILLFFSCAEDKDPVVIIEPEKDFQPLIITAKSDSVVYQETGTRAYGSFSYKVLWDENDVIYAYDKNGNKAHFNLIEGKNTTKGYFEQDASDQVSLEGQLTAFYPADLLKADGTLVWPSLQTYSGIMSGMPMYSKKTLGTDNNFGFMSLGGVYQLLVGTPIPNKQLDYFVIKSANTSLSGNFEINNSNYTAVIKTEGGSVRVNLQPQMGITDVVQTINVYLPVISDADLTLVFYASDGSKSTVNVTETIERAHAQKRTIFLNSFIYSLEFYVQEQVDPITKEFNAPITSITPEVLGKKTDADYPTPLNIISIEFPSSVQTIGNNAFLNEAHLVDVSLNEGLVTIGDNAFDTADKLTTLTIPSSVTTIGGFAFAGCTGLESITFTGSAPSIENIGEHAFSFAGHEGGIDIIVPAAELDSYTSLFTEIANNCYEVTFNVKTADSSAETLTAPSAPDGYVRP